MVGTTSARALPLGALSDWVGPGVSGQLDSVRAVIDELVAAPAGMAVVVGVDDVALLDDLSTFVVHQIVRRGSAKLLFTVRDGDPASETTQELWGSGQFEHLALQPLSREEVSDLVSDALGGQLDPGSAERLWRLTRGNVLYLRNIVEHEVVDGRLLEQGGLWTWTGDPVIPPSLVELIQTRMGALPIDVSDVLDVLAVAEPLDLAALSRITGPEAVEDADIRGLITLDKMPGRMDVRLAHPLYGEIRRERAAPTRLRRLKGLIATRLAVLEGAEEVQNLVRRAALSVDSDLTPDADLLAAGAQGAVSLADMTLADRLADAAIRAGAGLQAYFIRSWALAWANPREADAVLASIPAVGLTEQEGAMLAGFRFSNLLWGLADPDGAKTVLDEASRRASSRTRGWVDPLYIMYWASMASPEAAIRSAANVVLQELPPLMGAAISWALGVAYGDAGDTANALATFDVGYDIVTRNGQGPHLRFLIGDRHLGALLQAGRINEAVSLAEQLRAQAADLPGVADLLGTAIAGRAALGAGRVQEAHALLEPVINVFFAGGDVNGLGYRYQICDILALAMGGTEGKAGAALDHLERHRYRSYGFVDFELDLARAWVAASRGVTSTAIEMCLSAAQNACKNGQFAAEVLCLQTATQFGARSCGARLRELESVVEGPRARLAAQLSAALSADDAAGLAALSDEFETIGDLAAAVDAAALAAIVYRNEGRRGSALVCSTRAENLADQGGLLTPALRRASERVPLTDREREIVMLIGQKLSTPAIAERLTLSRRTVENHIYRAMAKTGVANREQLAALLPHRNIAP